MQAFITFKKATIDRTAHLLLMLNLSFITAMEEYNFQQAIF